jgi:hypothetical protein
MRGMNLLAILVAWTYPHSKPLKGIRCVEDLQRFEHLDVRSEGESAI